MTNASPPPAADAPPVAASVPATAADASVPAPVGDHDASYGAPETYTPDDYRWVPVRRRARYDGWTEEKQRRFIEVLADTGQVRLAAKTVGMAPESAYRLRRAAHAAAFARAWDAARHYAGTVLEDVAFERAIEGAEHNVYDEEGAVVCTKRVHNDRLLMFLLRHLKPERYAGEALANPAPPPAPLEVTLREMEPALPAPADALLDADTLDHELLLADVADGTLPHFLREQRHEKSPECLAAEADIESERRGAALCATMDGTPSKKGEPRDPVSHQDMVDITRHLDPGYTATRSRKRYR